MHARKTFSFKELLSVANLLSLARIPLAVIMILLYSNKLFFFMHKNFARSFWAGFKTPPFRAKFLAS